LKDHAVPNRFSSLLGDIARSPGYLRALVDGSARQQQILSEGFTALLAASAAQQSKLTALLEGSAATQYILGELLKSSGQVSSPFVDRLNANGFAVVRNFLDDEEASGLTRMVTEIYAEMNKASMNKASSFEGLDPDFEKNFRDWRGIWLEPLPKFLNGNLAQRYLAFTERLQNHVRGTFGSYWKFYPHRSFFRRHEGVAKAVPWHIDADAAQLNREDCINIWMPLDSVGRDLPSLEVVPKSQIAMRAIPLLTDADRWRDDAFVAKLGRAEAPVLEPGDAMAFDQYTLHRTQPIGSEGTIRTACEFRFARG
jgi:ectoine hydroxylase-related dioxygenase (phytanoyl-CoA dioxygenase family)